MRYFFEKFYSVLYLKSTVKYYKNPRNLGLVIKCDGELTSLEKPSIKLEIKSDAGKSRSPQKACSGLG